MDPNNTLHIKDKWEIEFGAIIPIETWTQGCEEAHSVTSSNIWREFRWKIITRYFRTPHIIAKWNQTGSDKCWRQCGQHIGNHTHIMWSCPKLEDYWKEVFDALKEIFHREIPKDPMVVLLGIIPEGVTGRNNVYLLQILLAAAIKCITFRWLKIEPPSYNDWILKVYEIYEMEKITYAVRLQKEKFLKRWMPVLPLILQ